MSKFLLNLLQISKALVNSKIQFLIQKFFFLTFGPANLAAHSAFGPAGPHRPPFSRRPKPIGCPKPLSPRVDSSIACFQVRSAHSTECLLRRVFPTVARSCPTLCHPLLPPVRLTSVPSPFFLNRGEVPCTGMPFRPIPASLPRDSDCGPPWTGAARGPRARGLGPRISLRNIIPGNSNFRHFALSPLCFSKINPQSMILQLGPKI
jgi:hypothetical protein